MHSDTPPDDDGADLKELGQKIDHLKPAPATAPQSNAGNGMNLAIEMVMGPLVGAGVGLGLDRLLDTKPILLIGFFFLGAASVFLRLYKLLTKGVDDTAPDDKKTS